MRRSVWWFQFIESAAKRQAVFRSSELDSARPDCQGKQLPDKSLIGKFLGLEDLDREAQRFRKVSQLSQSALPSKALGRLAGFGLAVGVEILHDLTLTTRNAKEPIKRPQKSRGFD